MIPQTPEELLALIQENSPDPRQSPAAVREGSSAFLKEMQEETVEHAVYRTERVPLPAGASGTWITLPETYADRIILFFHGGGFTQGSTADHLGLCIRLARAARARVFSIDYRLAPESPFPAAAEDALNAWRYLTAHGVPPHRILPAGISSGGNLVLSLLLSLRDESAPLPRAAVCLSPVTDFAFPGESVLKNQERDWITPAYLQAVRTAYLGERDPSDSRASPVYSRLAGLPRLYIQVGTHEALLSDVGNFVDKARWAGVPVQAEIWEGMFHGWHLFADVLAEGAEAVDHTGLFIADLLAR